MSESGYRNLLQRLADGAKLNFDEAYTLARAMLEGKLSDIEIAAVLTALRVRGESPEEIAGFAYALRQVCVKVPVDDLRDKLIDTAGTGGDGLHTVNVSTAAALLAACCGGYVLKHGNRAMSSKSGSADFMEALGYRIDHEPYQVRKMLEETRFAFVFAQKYHPLLKTVAPVRRTLGFRTIFNLVGPLANPGLVKRQVLGVARLDLAKVMVEAASLLGYEKLLVVHGEPGIDEVSVTGKTYVTELRGGKIEKYIITPEDLGLPRHSLSELQVEDAKTSVEKVLAALQPGRRDAVRSFILANTAFALYCADVVKDLRDGVELATKVIEDGEALSYIRRVVELSNKV